MRLRSAAAIVVTLLMGGLVAGTAQADSSANPTAVRASLRTELNRYLSTHRVPEHISAVGLAVTFRGNRPGINVAVGTTRYGDGRPISPFALWQIGSNTKAVTGVLILKLEAEHKLSINDTVGKWLPQYRAWRRITIKQLLNMTSGIPSYTGEDAFWADYAAAPDRLFSTSRLVRYALGSPLHTGYYYSNTAYILAQLIIERATHDSYANELRTRIFAPLGVHNMFYTATSYGRAITARVPAGYWFTPGNDQMASQLGRDQSRHTVSWAQGAGGIVSSLQDMAKWDRALYTNRELPRKQQRELESLVSQTTGKPIRTTTLADPGGFGLGIIQVTTKTFGTVWFYEGETNGFRVVHIYVPRSGAVIAIGLNSATNPADNDHIGALGASVYQILHKAAVA